MLLLVYSVSIIVFGAVVLLHCVALLKNKSAKERGKLTDLKLHVSSVRRILNVVKKKK